MPAPTAPASLTEKRVFIFKIKIWNDLVLEPAPYWLGFSDRASRADRGRAERSTASCNEYLTRVLLYAGIRRNHTQSVFDAISKTVIP